MFKIILKLDIIIKLNYKEVDNILTVFSIIIYHFLPKDNKGIQSSLYIHTAYFLHVDLLSDYCKLLIALKNLLSSNQHT